MKSVRMTKYGIAAVLLSFILYGCSVERQETPTKGEIKVLVSETVAPVIQLEREKFEELYEQAHVNLISTSTREAIVQFFNVDSIRLIVSSRPLNKEEQAVAKRENLKFQEYKVAIDAVAIITHQDNPVKQLRTTQLDSVYRGMITSWKSLGWKNSGDQIAICLPDPNSGEFEIIGTKVLKAEKFGSASKIVTSSPEMLRYVSEHSGALGVVSVSWLREYQGKVNVMELLDPYLPDSLGVKGRYFTPLQAHMYRGFYPLTSDVTIYSRLDLYSVGAGFISFVTSAAGQKIFLNNGLVPATMPVRLVELTNKDL